MLEQFKLEENTRISQVTVTSIMGAMGFIHFDSNADLEAVQTIWQHLQPVSGSPTQEDNGERVVVADLRVFMAAILGFQAGKAASSSNVNPGMLGTRDEQTGEYMLSSGEL